MTQNSRQRLGKLGEDLACRELGTRGYVILARRYRTKYGEIDIVARDDDTIVFVEVKTRGRAEFGSGAEAVTWWKRERMARMATVYLERQHLLDRPCRFDVVEITLDAAGRRIEVYRNAFDVGAA